MTAIETLKYLLDKAESETPEEHQLVSVNIPVDVIREIISTAQQWIPCSERLPDMYRRYYLVSLADKKEVDIAYFTEYGTWETFRNDEVKAWMPLPESYKGE